MRLDGQTRLYAGIAAAPEARRRALLGHLAAELGRPEADIAILRDPMGKPYLADPGLEYWFNCSSVDGLLLIASSRTGPVGADIETVQRCIPVWEDASRTFAPAEQALLAALNPPDRPLAFARLWTAKEAVLKASGTGIVHGMAEPGLEHLDDLPAPPPWRPVQMHVGGECYAVTWYTLPIDEVLVIAARAETSPKPGKT
ncbi:4'-phosphopantetheinyl transferase superfamily protein [Magnetospirillum sp. XM-1]|uniref:4'-phosphopantetheinyl transferase family protein n=1 Tax=Magnetospirillum sp. XM-1 TaxID=1663591 RepID=UPI001E5D5E01|nr:4'-phosphopantetheinyl transferase superfamily protein [Magnetospirillum sp. XM-1]